MEGVMGELNSGISGTTATCPCPATTRWPVVPLRVVRIVLLDEQRFARIRFFVVDRILVVVEHRFGGGWHYFVLLRLIAAVQQPLHDQLLLPSLRQHQILVVEIFQIGLGRRQGRRRRGV
uniref:Uncharacterized protein n=1 Tax=Anopheles coluzzii TaxID=1518534 RepID=A0A8W7PPF9_ANOCL